MGGGVDLGWPFRWGGEMDISLKGVAITLGRWSGRAVEPFPYGGGSIFGGVGGTLLKTVALSLGF